MARFRLLAPHVLDIKIGDKWTPALFEAGHEFDASERRVPPGPGPSRHWQPTPHMLALDPEAEQLMRSISVEWAQADNDGTLVGFGPTQLLPYSEDDVTGGDGPQNGGVTG